MSSTRHIHNALLLVASVLLIQPANAQTTNCRWFGSTWTCETAPPVVPSQPVKPIPYPIPSQPSLVDAIRAGQEARAREEARRVERAVPPPAPAPAPAYSGASITRGTGLVEACTSTDADFRFACEAYMRGVLDGQMGIMPRPYCLPDDTTTRQAIDIAVGYIAANPDFRNLPSAAITQVALGRAFPCPAK